MKQIIMVSIGIVVLGLMVGCEPDKITVEVPVSAIEKARKGEVVYLKARAEGASEIAPDSILEKKEQVQQIVARALGEGGRVNLRKRSAGLAFSAQWKIPFFKQGNTPKTADGYPLWLVLSKDEDRLVLLANQSRINSMNEKLDDLDFMFEKISELGMTEIVFNNDGNEPFSYKVYGVFIDSKPKIAWTEKVAPGDESTVAFGRKSEDSIWHETAPVVFLSEK